MLTLSNDAVRVAHDRDGDGTFGGANESLQVEQNGAHPHVAVDPSGRLAVAFNNVSTNAVRFA